MARKENGKLRELIQAYGIKDMKDVHEFVKMLTAETIGYFAPVEQSFRTALSTCHAPF